MTNLKRVQFPSVTVSFLLCFTNIRIRTSLLVIEKNKDRCTTYESNTSKSHQTSMLHAIPGPIFTAIVQLHGGLVALAGV
jgi:hypothetical protein